LAPNYNCTIDNTLVGGGSVTVGDIIQYFVVAQDTAGNLSANPSAGFVGTNVNTVTTPPTTPNTYTISATFTGSYSVGTAETITSLTNTGGLFAQMNAGTVSGNVTISLTSDLTAETGTISLNQQVEEGLGAGTFTITFKPSSSPRVVSGSAASCLINLNGADRVTFDGAFTGTSKDTTFSNTNTAGATVCFVNAATNNVLKNSIVKGVSTSTTNGVVFFSTVATGIIGNSNNTVENNDISGGATATTFGVFNSGTTTAKNSANLIKKNRIFDFSTTGIRDNGNSAGNIYTQNEIFEVTTQTLDITGFRPSSTTIDGFTFSRNFIHDLNTTSVGTVIGIHLFDTSTVATSEISNNMITLSTLTPLTLRGIWDQTATGEKYNLFYNSVYLGGVVTGASNSEAYNWSIASTTTAQNNIFMNARTGGTGKHYAYRTNTTLANLTSDFNDIFATGGTGNVFGNNGTADVADLTTWKLAPTVGTGKDANSVSGDPLFANPLSNLHISGLSPAKGKGIAIGGVTNDFDGQTRSVLASPNGPDMGADELVFTATSTSVSYAEGGLSTNFTITNSGVNPATVTYETADDSPLSAIGGGTCGGTVDYITIPTTSATIAAGGSLVVPFSICADIGNVQDTGNETLKFIVTNTSGAGFIGSPSSTSIMTITNQLPPTAASASVRGRLLTPTGRGLMNAFVDVTNTSTGEVRRVRSTSLGYFNFTELPVGVTYVINVQSKRYAFNSQSITLEENIDDLVLTAQP
jgi:Carboxypeptidase regulatory-like domain